MLSTLLTLLITVFVFGILIFIHEFGHYLVARLFKVGVIEFSIGMGPKIKTWKGKYNDFSIRAIPIGGFVNMVGEYDDEIPEEHKYKIPLNSRPVWKRMLIVIAGPVMNILLAFLVMFFVVCGSVIGNTTVHSFVDGAISCENGLQAQDKIVQVNGKDIHCFNDLSYILMSDGEYKDETIANPANPDEEITVRFAYLDLKVIRNGEPLLLEDVKFYTFAEDGITFAARDFYVEEKSKNFGNLMYETYWQTCSSVYMTVDSLIDTFSGKYGMEAVGGPIAIGGEINTIIQESSGFKETALYIADITVLISISLGIFNLLPIPVLDGGRLLFYIIEAIRRKPMNKKTEQTISGIFTILLFGLMIFVAFKDIIGLF